MGKRKKMVMRRITGWQIYNWWPFLTSFCCLEREKRKPCFQVNHNDKGKPTWLTSHDLIGGFRSPCTEHLLSFSARHQVNANSNWIASVRILFVVYQVWIYTYYLHSLYFFRPSRELNLTTSAISDMHAFSRLFFLSTSENLQIFDFLTSKFTISSFILIYLSYVVTNNQLNWSY